MTGAEQHLDERALRALVPRVLAGLVRRGEQFDTAEDALQEALLEALRVWPEHPPRDPRAWLTTVATRRLVDARRSEASRGRREEEVALAEPARVSAAEPADDVAEGDDTLFLLFCCCNPQLSPASQVALTLRAVGGLTTAEIADCLLRAGGDDGAADQPREESGREAAGSTGRATSPSCCACCT